MWTRQETNTRDPSQEQNTHIYKRDEQRERMISEITFFLETHMEDEKA